MLFWRRVLLLAMELNNAWGSLFFEMTCTKLIEWVPELLECRDVCQQQQQQQQPPISRRRRISIYTVLYCLSVCVCVRVSVFVFKLSYYFDIAIICYRLDLNQVLPCQQRKQIIMQRGGSARSSQLCGQVLEIENIPHMRMYVYMYSTYISILHIAAGRFECEWTLLPIGKWMRCYVNFCYGPFNNIHMYVNYARLDIGQCFALHVMPGGAKGAWELAPLCDVVKLRHTIYVLILNVVLHACRCTHYMCFAYTLEFCSLKSDNFGATLPTWRLRQQPHTWGLALPISMPLNFIFILLNESGGKDLDSLHSIECLMRFYLIYHLKFDLLKAYFFLS